MSSTVNNLIVLRGKPNDVTQWVQKACQPLEGSHRPELLAEPSFFMWRLFHHFVPVEDDALVRMREQGQIDFDEHYKWGITRGVFGSNFLSRPHEHEAHLQFGTYYEPLGDWLTMVARDHPALEFEHYWVTEDDEFACRIFRRGKLKETLDFDHIALPVGKWPYAVTLEQHAIAYESISERIQQQPKKAIHLIERANVCLNISDSDSSNDDDDREDDQDDYPPANPLAQAQRDLDQAARLGATTSADYWMTRSKLHHKRGESAAELECLTAAIKANPSCPEAYFHRAVLYGNLKKDSAERRDLNTAIKLFPSFPLSYLRRSWSHKSNAKQLQDLNRYCELDSGDWFGPCYRGIFYMTKTKEYTKACCDFEECRWMNGDTDYVIFYKPDYVLCYMSALMKCSRESDIIAYGKKVIDKHVERGKLQKYYDSELAKKAVQIVATVYYQLSFASLLIGNLKDAKVYQQALVKWDKRYPDEADSSQSDMLAKFIAFVQQQSESKKEPTEEKTKGKKKR